jgi:hypothetical protein
MVIKNGTDYVKTAYGDPNPRGFTRMQGMGNPTLAVWVKDELCEDIKDYRVVHDYMNEMHIEKRY